MAKKKEYNPISYVGAANPGKYTSAYKKQIDDARNNLMTFKYNPLQDARYQAMAQIYGARGNQAAQDTLGEAAALNGGMQTSFAVSAAQQARNQYNQELAALVPDLEENAYNRLQNNYNLLMDADTDAYQKYRDRVADYQWGKNYDTDVYWAKKSSAGSGGGGGRRRSSGGGGGYSSGANSDDYLRDLYNKTAQKLNKKQTYGPQMSAAQTVAAIAKNAVNQAKKKSKK